MQPLVIPAILTKKFSDFKQQIKKVDNIAPYIQIDVGDGIFVPTKTFLEIDKINNLKIKTPFELHLMVQNPIAEMEKWKNIKNVFRIVFHIESPTNHRRCLYAIRSQCWQAGIAISPKTKTSFIKQYLNFVNIVQFMTVSPGNQGSPFIPEVKRKVREFTKNKEIPLVSVDGGIKKHNIAEIQTWGVDIFNIGSALIFSKNIKKTYKELKKELKK